MFESTDLEPCFISKAKKRPMSQLKAVLQEALSLLHSRSAVCSLGSFKGGYLLSSLYQLKCESHPIAPYRHTQNNA
jgi:hypothetical protein